MVEPSSFIQNLEPYSITPQDVWSDMATDNILKLDWNEAPVDFEFYQDELSRIVHDRGIIAWYPDCLALKLTDEISKYVGIDRNNILTFPGSDVGLECLCRAYLEPGDKVLALCPTYENFFVYALQVGASLLKVELEKPFKPDLTIVEENMDSIGLVKMVYLVSPNNPCGYVLSQNEVEHLANKFQETIFIIDEAYIEFSDTKSLSSLVEVFQNIVITRTFSKGFGMADLRLGYICASLDIINVVNKIRNGKNISMIAQRLGVCALQNINKVQVWLKEVQESREKFQAWCENNNIKYYPSNGNFVLFEVSQPNEICSKLKSLGIYIRNRNLVTQGSIRVTIGSNKHVERLISALESMSNLL